MTNWWLALLCDELPPIPLQLFDTSRNGSPINVKKTVLAAVGEVEHIESWATRIGCKTENLPLTYLGLPLGAKYRCKALWKKVLERIEERLAGWKSASLSKGGRITLIKNTLSSIPLYALSIFPAPKGVTKIITSRMRNFLWGKFDESKGIPLVRWDQVCLPKELGGIGVKNLNWMNKALLAKWLWRFNTERDALWRNVILLKYGASPTGWRANGTSNTYGTSVWRGIFQAEEAFNSGLNFIVGDGASVRFWEDPWNSMEVFNITYNKLYEISNAKGKLIKDVIVERDGRRSWNFEFKRRLTNAEIIQVADLLIKLGEPSELSELPDTINWKLEQGGIYSVSSLYATLNTEEAILIPHKKIWNPKVPSKVCFLMWAMVLNKVLTVDNLWKQDQQMPNRCVLCKNQCETNAHLFLHCEFTF